MRLKPATKSLHCDGKTNAPQVTKVEILLLLVIAVAWSRGASGDNETLKCVKFHMARCNFQPDDDA